MPSKNNDKQQAILTIQRVLNRTRQKQKKIFIGNALRPIVCNEKMASGMS
jgi:hypothetical protein